MYYNLHSCVLLSNQVFVPVPVIVISSEPSLQTSSWTSGEAQSASLIKIGCFTDKNPVSLYFSASKVPNESSTKVPLAVPVHDMQLVLDICARRAKSQEIRPTLEPIHYLLLVPGSPRPGMRARYNFLQIEE